MSTQPELLAHHCTEAGLHQQAVGYWREAGQLGQTRAAHEEAIYHFSRGLAVLENWPETQERYHRELDLQTDQSIELTYRAH